MTDDTPIRTESARGVRTIRLNRPAVLNSFNRQMAARLREALAEASADASVRAVLLTGEGRAFCAGQDLAEVVPADGEPMPDLGATVARDYNPIIRAIRTMEKPVVCAVNGIAAGAGANLAFACDIVVAAEEAAFVQSFCKVGLIPDSGGTFMLPRLVGVPRAAALALLGEKVSATQARDWGMIWQAVPGAQLQETAFALAAQLATQPTRGLGLIKRGLNAALGHTLDQQLDMEEGLQREAGYTEDYAEGVRAFFGKRKPEFTGR